MIIKDVFIVLLIAGYFFVLRKDSELVWLTDILIGFTCVLLVIKYIIQWKSKK